VVELNKHTYKGPSNKSVFLCSLFSKSTPLPPCFHQENATEKYQFSNNTGNLYLCPCTPLSSSV